MIRAFSRHLRMLQPSIHSPGELLVIPMGLVLVLIIMARL